MVCTQRHADGERRIASDDTGTCVIRNHVHTSRDAGIAYDCANPPRIDSNVDRNADSGIPCGYAI